MSGTLPNRPFLRRHLAPHVFPGEGVVLLAEDDRYLLTGKVYEKLVPLLTSGRWSVDELVDRLTGDVPAEEVYYALMRLQSSGHLREPSDSQPRHSAAFWDATGVDPAAAATRIDRETVTVRYLGDILSLDTPQLLADLGLTVTPRGRWDILLVDDYLDPRLGEHNRLALTTGRPWVLCKPVGTEVWVGPLFVPGETVCWECLSHRLAQRRPLEAYLRARHRNGQPPYGPPATLVSSAHAGLAMLAASLLRAFGSGDADSLRNTVSTYDTVQHTGGVHPVTRRPQCPGCGDPEAFTRLASAPVVLSPRPKRARGGSGGYRSSSLGDSYRRFERHVDPVTGIVPGLRRHVARGSRLIHAYGAGPNVALRLRRLPELREAIRSTNAGKGRTRLEARVSALGEAIERYSGVFQGDEPRIRSRMEDLEGAIHPNACMRFSEAQYRNREAWNRRAWLGDYVPRPFDPGEAVEWTPVWSLSRQRTAYLPTMLLFADYPCPLERRFCFAESNGAAAGNCLEEAVLHGLLELVERDCVSLWWYNRVPRPAVDDGNLLNGYFGKLRHAYRTLGREWWILDLTTDLAIPCFAAVTRKTEGPEEILLGLGAHLDPEIAVKRAVTEMNQVVVLATGRNSPFQRDDRWARWLREASVDRHPYLAPSPSPSRELRSMPRPDRSDLRDDVEWACRHLGERGLEVLVSDQTRPDVGVSVARVVVPGLRSFRSRFGPGRLYEVPVSLGWLARPTPEPELNPVGFFL